ncbi:MAG: tetratricopeptide repeat protein [Lysobacterales bacterium]
MSKPSRQAYDIYLGAVDLDPNSAAEFIQREARSNPEVMAEVHELLDSALKADEQGFLNEPIPSEIISDAITPDPSVIGRHYGPFRVTKNIGQGGFGTVYRAQQTQPVQREVALKLIRADLSNVSLINRFESECQTLASLNHPNIAKIFDAGSGPSGEPWMAMEYIPGIPINQFCDENRLNLEQRLNLFISVCQALQHAHHKGVIHRDVKPANVLVHCREGRIELKVIDFGIAKVVDPDLARQSMATGSGLLGSPAYMSPEQISQPNADIDTRTDVYALGVLLHELLTGFPPFAGNDESIVQMLNRIIQDEPTPPSRQVVTRQTSSYGHRGLGSDTQLANTLKGDLDWIILRALAREREQRYSSAASLADDVQRFLDHQPVLAHAPSLAYRLGKFVRRHTLAVSAAAVIAVSIVAGVIGTGMGFVNANNEAARARHAEQLARISEATALEQTRTAEKTVSLLLQFLTSADPRERGKDLTVVELLDAFAPQLPALAEQPLVQSALMFAYAKTYNGLGLFPQASTFAHNALNIRIDQLGPDDPRTLSVQALLIDVERESGEYDAALERGRQVMQLASETLGDHHPLTLEVSTSTAAVLEKLGKYEDAEDLHRQSVVQHEAALGPDHPLTLEAMSRLSTTLWRRNALNDAEAIALKVVARRKALLGPDHPDTLASMNELAVIVTDAERLEEGQTLHRHILQRRQKVLGTEHPKTLISMSNLAWVLGKRGEHSQAEQLARQAWEIEKRVLGENHPGTLVTLGTLAGHLGALGRLDEAEPLYRKVWETRQAVMGLAHPETLTGLNDLAVNLARQGRNTQARSLLTELVSQRQNALGPNHVGTLTSMSNLASVHRRLGELELAETLYRETLRRRKNLLGIEHTKTWRSIENLTKTLILRNRLDQADHLVASAIEEGTASVGQDHPTIVKGRALQTSIQQARRKTLQATQ